MEKRTLKSLVFALFALLYSFSLSAQAGTDKILYENAAGNQAGVYSIDALKTYINTGVGGVTSVSVVTGNGFTGTVATPTTTPSITLGTNVTGLLKGNGTGMVAATAGTDYVIPSGSITGTASNVTGTVAVANGGTGVTTLTGIAKGNGTGAFTAAVAGDFPILNQNTTGVSANVTGVVAIGNGGTGSSTQNFVDLSTAQASIGGAKTFTGGFTSSGETNINGKFNVAVQSTSTGATLTLTGAETLKPINSTTTTTITVTAGATNTPIIELPLLSTSTGSVVIQSSGSETFNGSSTYTVTANSQNTTIKLRKISSTAWLASLNQ